MAAPLVPLLIFRRFWRFIVIAIVSVVMVVVLAFMLIFGAAAAALPGGGDGGGGEEDDGGGDVPVEVKGGWAHPLGKPTPYTMYPGHPDGAMDFPVPEGTAVYAVAAGTVNICTEPIGGNCVGVDHTPNLCSIAAHLSSIEVQAGDKVEAGDLLARSGNTGTATTGPHVHFGFRSDGCMNQGVGDGFAQRVLADKGIDLGPCLEGC